MFELVFKLKNYFERIIKQVLKEELDSHDSPFNTKKPISPFF